MEATRLAACKKNAGPRGTIVFVDESGFSEGSVIRRTWAPRGQTPVLRTKGGWKRLSMLGGLAYATNGARAPRLLLHFARGAFRAGHFLRFLQHLARHVHGRIVLVWDNLSAHKSKVVKQWLMTCPRIRVTHLPPYAPELNPVEAL